MKEIEIKKRLTNGHLCLMWLAAPPLSLSPPPFFPLSLPSFGIIIIVDMVVVVVPVCCVMWWLGCTHKSLKIFFYTEVISACPSHITWLWFKSMLCFLTHCIFIVSTHATTNTNGEWPPSALFPTPMPGMTNLKAGVDGQTGGFEMRLHLKPQVSSFFSFFFCSANIFFYYNYITSVWTTTAMTNTHLHQQQQQHFEFQCVIFFSVFFFFFFALLIITYS